MGKRGRRVASVALVAAGAAVGMSAPASVMSSQPTIATTPAVAEAAAWTRCRGMPAQPRGRFVVRKKGRVTCRGARKLMRLFLVEGRGRKHGGPYGYNTYWTLYGWKCGTGAGGGGCSRPGGRRVQAWWVPGRGATASSGLVRIAPSEQAAHASQLCKSVKDAVRRGVNPPDAVRVRATRTGCRTARRLARRFYPAFSRNRFKQPVRLRRWSCSFTEAAGFPTRCIARGGKRVTWRFPVGQGARASTGSPPVATAEVHDCPNFQLVAFVYDRSVRNMPCYRAKRLTRGSYGRHGFHFRAARRAGFRCRRIGSVYEGAVYRCQKGSNARAFRFTHGA